tara:strand:+ start:800 stop:4003 length:3204 start_codon:yes stop_codon:yes gene_type:complete
MQETITEKGLKIPRYFTREGVNPFEMFTYVKKSSIIKNPDGSLVFQMDDVEVPDFWTQTAADVLAQKYLRKAGVPLKNEQGEVLRDENGKIITGSETSIKQVAHRIAGCWRHWGEKYNYFHSASDAQIFYEEMVYMIINQNGAPNSPQWFNTGLNFAYGITGPPQGHSYVEPETGEHKLSQDAYTRCQPHACFIQSVNDDLVRDGGIFSLLTREARIFKYGSGSGSNFSSLRGKGEKLSGGGTSSGMMSFLKIFDVAAGSIKSGGTTRRAAKMVSLDLDHPEIENFIWWKVREEEKVADLVAGSKILKKRLEKVIKLAKNNPQPLEDKEVHQALKEAVNDHIPMNYLVRTLDLAKQGYDFPLQEFNTHYESEAYITVAGQNSNNSIRIPNTFFEALDSGKDWELKGRINGEVMKTLPAAELWDQVGYCAWASADPGVQFDTTINEWHTCPESGKINGSNPCSEYMFIDDSACNLSSLNLAKFYHDNTGTFDIKGFQYAVRLWTIVLEISVLMAHFPSDKIAINSYEFRTLGLGFANLGTLLMLQSIPYDSDKGRAIAGALASIMTGESYATSAEMAKDLGTFKHYQLNKEHMLRVIRNHRRAAYAQHDYELLTIKPQPLDQQICPSDLLQAAQQAWDKALSLGEQHGYRNAQTTLMAPTGTIAFVMDCDTTGIEPDYALVKYKKLAGGGFFKIVNQSVPKALKRLGYNEQEIKEIVDYCIGKGTFVGSPHINRESLLQKGLSEEQINAIEKELGNSMDINFMFNQWTLGEEFYNKVIQNCQENNFLIALGFTQEQIDAANGYICGTMTLEGAPHLKTEHYPVFDCANKCGKKGQRYIHPYGHLKMLAMVQSFVSGAISKTINMPSDWTVEQIKKAYYDAWTMMIKATALYRDGCKLSQPLNTTLEEHPEMKKLLEDDLVEDNLVNKTVMIGAKELKLTAKLEQEQLQEVCWNMEGITPAQGAMLHALVNNINVSLQHGLPISKIVQQSLNVAGHPIIGELQNFLGELSNQQLPQSVVESKIEPTTEPLIASSEHNEQLKCAGCGATQLRPSGTCLVCEICGDTTGCS